MTSPPIETAEHSALTIIRVTPTNTLSTDYGGTYYDIEVETDPMYASDDYDKPIKFTHYEPKLTTPLELDVKEAEGIGIALLRAVEIRRKVVAENIKDNP